MAHFTPASSSPLCTSGLEGGGELAVAVAAAAVAASTRGGSRLRRRSPQAPKADAVFFEETELLVQAKTVDQSKSETDADATQRGLQDLNEKLQLVSSSFFDPASTKVT
uniref:Uncharacterized protein n=1 Tax=Oryza glumipatula TaxID=40148 RepID=A0A0E0BPU4_9ORYZ